MCETVGLTLGNFVALADEDEWTAEIERWAAPAIDVYFGAGYHRAFMAASSAGYLFRFEQASDRLVYPFLLRPIARIGDQPIVGGYHDVESVYGFCGPVSTTEAPGFLAAAWDWFDAWCAERRVVAEFVRLNPMLANERYCSAAMTTSVVREHVILDLTRTEEDIWLGYSSINRNMIRKARKRGVQCRLLPLNECMDRFIELYNATMDRNAAAPSYYFGREAFRVLAATTRCFACEASVDGRVEAVSLFLVGGDRVHYHLSGCSDAGLRCAANNLLLHTAVIEAKRLGLRLCHFGGGRTGSPTDPLLRFKQNFSTGRLSARTGRRVHDRARYEEFCSLGRRQSLKIPSDYFLAYRFEPSTNHEVSAAGGDRTGGTR